MASLRLKKRFAGWRLSAYNEEYKKYNIFRCIKVTSERATEILSEMKENFKVSKFDIVFNKRRDSGHYKPKGFRLTRTRTLVKRPPSIHLNKMPSVAVICHEFTHHLTDEMNPEATQWHGPQFLNRLDSVYLFAQRYLF
jgi:hypothetical protein